MASAQPALLVQIFRRSSNTVARIIAAVAVVGPFGLAWATYAVYWSPWTTRAGTEIPQPVPFSHKHHVEDDGIDCRYCHTSVEKSGFAGVPSTEICMTCHAQIWTQAPMLAPVRESLATRRRLRWNRVHDLPDFVFFDHSIHLAKGIGCSTCHGRIDQMALTSKQESLYMKWCVDCHADPAKFIRPRDDVLNMAWQPPPSQSTDGARLLREYHIDPTTLRDCGTCHR